MGGRSDVKKHCNGSKHKKNYKKINDNSVNIGDNSVNVNDENNVFKLTPQEEVIMAETMQALKVVSSDYSFSSTTDDSDDFRHMFPDSVIAQKYHQSKTKVNYVIKHGISPYVKDLYINDFNGTPFVFKFDETTTLQVKKQYDGYIQYWSKETNLVNSVYCGSLFVGHCFSKDLIQHFTSFCEDMKWEPDLMLQIGMDGPNVNTKFERDLSTQIFNNYGVSFLKLGSCSLHVTHNAFRKGINAFGFDVETFVSDTSYFFKLSPARRQDYKLMELFTAIEAKYALKHTSTQWLSMKNPVLRILEQWENINEYFLKYLPKQDNFNSQIKSSSRYKRIVTFLKNPTSKAELCFIAFVAHDFEDYLSKMQTSEPMIHCMYQRISSLIFNLMKKFVTHAAITETVDGTSKAKQGSELVSVDLSKHKRKLETIDIGTRAKEILSEFSINSESKEAMREKCMAFYTASTKYLISKLPVSNQFLKDAQYLHPDKRNYVSSLNAISRLALAVATSLKNHLQSVFSVSENTTVSEVVDLINNQWQIYQLSDIPKEWHTIESDNAKK